MPYKHDPDVFERLISSALEDGEIKEGLAASGLPPEFLRSRVSRDAEVVWEAAAREIEEHNRLESEIATANAVVTQSLPVRPWIPGFIEKLATVVFGVGFWILIITYVILGFRAGWATPFRWIAAWLPTPTGIVVVGSLLAATLILAALHRYQTRAHLARYRTIEARQRASTGIEDLEKRFEAAAANVESAVLRGIVSEYRDILGTELAPSYSTTLTMVRGSGLSEVFDPAYEVRTDSKDELRAHLEGMPGGSIGIAGPRGVGKTTLIRSFCSGAVASLRNRPVLAVMTSAPVDYVGREFILHLFSSLCQKTLQVKGVPDDRSISSAFPVEAPPLSRRMLRTLGAAGLVLGLGLVLVGGVGTAILGSSPPASTLPPAVSASTSGRPAGSDPSAARSSAAEAPAATHSVRQMLATQVASVLSWGILVTGIGLLVGLFPELQGWVRAQHKRTQELEGYAQGSSVPGASVASETALSPIVEQAQRWLKEIRFQHSYSTGWSGALKLPLGLETEVTTAVSFAQHQLSLPEIVEGYRRFLALLAGEYTVLIGIDELDKIETDEKAHRFLNEVKVLFGVEGCFYLVSVSESAMSTFERRGLPFRDALDSTFDNVLYVDYLSGPGAHRLLRRRVIGLPVPFLWLCHCLSGGLARDLIRTCRDLVAEAAKEAAPQVITRLAPALVRTDLADRLRGITVAVKSVSLEPEAGGFLADIWRVENGCMTATELLAASSRLMAPPAAYVHGTTAVTPESQAVMDARRRLAELRSELGHYLYYCASLLEFFGGDVSEEALRAAEGSRVLDQLARARQSFSSSPAVARTLVDGFRSATGLTRRAPPPGARAGRARLREAASSSRALEPEFGRSGP